MDVDFDLNALILQELARRHPIILRHGEPEFSEALQPALLIPLIQAPVQAQMHAFEVRSRRVIEAGR